MSAAGPPAGWNPPPGPYGAYGPYGAPPTPARPATVTVAGVLTAVLGGLGILGSLLVGLGIAILGTFIGEVSEGKSPGEGSGVTAFFVAIAVGFVVIGVGGSVLYLLLGLRVLRGGATARVVLTVWNVLGVLAALAWIGSSVANTLADSQGGATDVIGAVVWSAVPAAPAVLATVLLWTASARAWFDLPEQIRR